MSSQFRWLPFRVDVFITRSKSITAKKPKISCITLKFENHPVPSTPRQPLTRTHKIFYIRLPSPAKFLQLAAQTGPCIVSFESGDTGGRAREHMVNWEAVWTCIRTSGTGGTLLSTCSCVSESCISAMFLVFVSTSGGMDPWTKLSWLGMGLWGEYVSKRIKGEELLEDIFFTNYSCVALEYDI
jgi:hypothetical protein